MYQDSKSNGAAQLHGEVTGWRRHIHQNPETGFDVENTAAFVTQKLKSFGCDEVVTGIGRTGVVGVIRGSKGDGPVIGLRADMDALSITEASGKPHASLTPGKMHACGHDGHTAMLLGAAKELARTRDFAGRVAVIFQPAEEGGGGGREMVDDGLMERFGIERVFGMHNLPGLPVGQFAIRPGPMMAATALFLVRIVGRGGHAAMPNKAIDPIVIGAQLVSAVQTVASRATDPIDSIVVTVTNFHGGEAMNAIPESVKLAGTVRALRTEVLDRAEQRLKAICEGLALANEAEIEFEFRRGYPATINHAAETVLAGNVAAAVVGEANINRQADPMLGAEDFAFMLNARPGAFIFLGNGDTAGLHHPAYDFDDAAIPFGIGYWLKLVKAALVPDTHVHLLNT